MTTLNSTALDIILEAGPHAMTDVTGFGFLGHLSEMLGCDALVAKLQMRQMPRIPGVENCFKPKCKTRAGRQTSEFLAGKVSFHQGIGAWDRELLFDPGTKRAYSNIGFEVLGAIIEQVSGVSFEKYMADNIFTPLGMKDSTFFYPDVPEALRTYGHTGDASSKQATPHYPYNRRHGPSSTLNTNIEDMSRFVFALLNGGDLDGALLLKPQTLTDMWRPRWTIHKEASHFATAGWIHEIRDGQRMLRHFGGDVGFRSVLAIMPDNKAAIFLVSNDDRANTRALALAVLAAMAEN